MWRFGLEAALRLVLGLFGAVVLSAAVASLAAGHSGGFLAPVASHFTAILHFDFGPSRVTGLPAASELLSRLPATAELLVVGAVVAFLVGIPLGLTLSFSTTLKAAPRALQMGAAIPPFVGIVTLIWAARLWHWPLATHGSPQALGLPVVDDASLFSDLQVLALPAMMIGAVGAGVVQRKIRRAAAAAMRVPYREGLRRLGLPSWEIRLHFVMPVIVAGLFAGLGDILLALIGADVIAEWVFEWPGAAAQIIKSVALQDWPVASLIILAFASAKMIADFVGSVAARALAVAGYS